MRDWPEPQAAGTAPQRHYAPESLLLAGMEAAARDAQVRAVVTSLPDGAGPPRRIGICNAAGEVYREVTLHGPVQVLYFWAGLNALGFRQRPTDPSALSRYWLLLDPAEVRPPPP